VIPAPTIYLSAGEPSGDAHASAVAAALKRRLPQAALEAFGGPRLEAAGARVLDRMERFSVVGVVEELAKIPAHYRLHGRVREALRAHRYDLLILVDYPGYHLRLATTAAAAGVPVLYYIAPQLWAWGEGRVKRLAAAVRRLAVILPFEEKFFRDRGVPVTFVGHPLKDRPPLPARADARRALGLAADRPVLGVFPGSRGQEVQRIWPIFRDAVRSINFPIVLTDTHGIPRAWKEIGIPPEAIPDSILDRAAEIVLIGHRRVKWSRAIITVIVEEQCAVRREHRRMLAVVPLERRPDRREHQLQPRAAGRRRQGRHHLLRARAAEGRKEACDEDIDIARRDIDMRRIILRPHPDRR